VAKGVSGVPPGRLPALQTVQERGWVPGTLLASTEWQVPRVVMACSTKRVRLKSVGKTTGQRSVNVDSFVHTLPVDVNVIGMYEIARLLEKRTG